MSEPLTPEQEAAAFHGAALNTSYTTVERLALALKALDLYEGLLEEDDDE